MRIIRRKEGYHDAQSMLRHTYGKALAALLLLCSVAIPAFSADKGETARRLARQGYVNIRQEDPTIHVSLMYSRADNFCGVVLYDDLKEAFLHPEAMAALKKAQAYLQQLRPDLSLKVYDAARPMSIQQKMWDKVKHTRKAIYVSNPDHGGGMHNYGMAVDITLCTLKGDTLDMGTKIDYMGKAAHIDHEDLLVHFNKCSRATAKRYYKVIP